jgi:glycosyltransferase involved in cell wall biosynthesis
MGAAMPASELRLAVFPPPGGQNPYHRLLHAALARRGVRIVPTNGLRRGWARKAPDHADAVHLHWVEFLYAAGGCAAVQAALMHKRAASLMAALRALRAAPVPVVWTVHNLRPHEVRFPWLADATIAAALRASDALVVHSRHAAQRLQAEFRPPVAPTVLPHPHYIGAYPEPRRHRAATRQALGIPDDAFTYLVFGQLRAYKRVPEAIAAFRRLDDPKARLVVAGGVSDQTTEREIAAARDGDDRVLLRLEPVPEAEVAELHAAADAAVLHYRDVFSSGALLLALSLGLPVVAPAGTTATELVDPPAIEAYSGDDPSLALAAIQAGSPQERREAAVATARSYAWDAMADGLLRLYRADR